MDTSTTDLDRCAGTLISHESGAVECTDDTCVDLDPARHGLYLDCAGIEGGCECAEPEPIELAFAS